MAEPVKIRRLSELPSSFSREPVAQPRQQVPVGGPSLFRIIMSSISARFPDLKKKLRQAEMKEEPSSFVGKNMVQAVVLTVVFLVLGFMVLSTANVPAMQMALLMVVLVPVFLAGFFWYGMQVPMVKVKQKTREIDKDLVFAGRHLLIELKSGIPLFDSMLNVTRDYGEVSKVFSRILERINVGVPADVAMHDVSDEVPSPAMKRVILQLVNSIRSGSDVASSLESVLDQLSREQVIEIKAYGQKLNPLVMFYMIFGIIIPSLGVALSIILVSFMNVPVGSEIFAAAFLLLALIQFIFMSMVESSRPRFEV